MLWVQGTDLSDSVPLIAFDDQWAATATSLATHEAGGGNSPSVTVKEYCTLWGYSG